MPPEAAELFQSGDLGEALQQAKDRVRQHPRDTSTRGFLCELLCFAGEIDRADMQLEVIAEQELELAPGIALFRQLLRAEKARQEFYEQGRVPELLEHPSENVKLSLEAAVHLQAGDSARARELLDEAESRRPVLSGTCNGESFDDFRDLSDLTAAAFELLTSTGKYYWVEMSRVEFIEFRPPKRPRDLMWREAAISVRDGPEGEVHLPTLYAGSAGSADDRIRLGRATDWKGGDGSPVIGHGLRSYLVGEQTRTILEIEELRFVQPQE